MEQTKNYNETLKPWSYERIVRGLLKKMTKGQLTLEHIGGQVETLGHEEKPKAHLRVKDSNFFRRIVLFGDIGLSESFLLNEWESDSVTDFIAWVIHNLDQAPSISGGQGGLVNFLQGLNRLSHLMKKNSLSGAEKNIQAHYDLSNDFFKTFLDPTMTYSCGHFEEGVQSLEEAQRRKFDSLIENLQLKKTDHLLEIGSGWGGLSLYIAEKVGCKITTITISQQQYDYFRAIILERGLDDQINLQFLDYRKLTGQYDKIVSVEMMEALGHEYIPVFFKKCAELLKPKGVLSFQVITSPDSRYDEIRKGIDFIQKHIFPGSLLPSIGMMNESINKVSDLHLVKFRDFGLFYARTLREWFNRFKANADEIEKLGFDETFKRKWTYYFNYCEAAFKMRNISVVQMTYSRPNNLEW